MMNELFPIIRRKRKPLLVADNPPVMVGYVEPVRVEGQGEDGGLKMEGRSSRPVKGGMTKSVETEETA